MLGDRGTPGFSRAETARDRHPEGRHATRPPSAVLPALVEHQDGRPRLKQRGRLCSGRRLLTAGCECQLASIKRSHRHPRGFESSLHVLAVGSGQSSLWTSAAWIGRPQSSSPSEAYADVRLRRLLAGNSRRCGNQPSHDGERCESSAKRCLSGTFGAAEGTDGIPRVTDAIPSEVRCTRRRTGLCRSGTSFTRRPTSCTPCGLHCLRSELDSIRHELDSRRTHASCIPTGTGSTSAANQCPKREIEALPGQSEAVPDPAGRLYLASTLMPRSA